MSTAPFPDFSSPIINGIHEVASHHVRKGLLDIIRDSSTGGKIRNGDYYLSRTRTMIKEHYPGLPFEDQNTVHYRFNKAVGAQDALEGAQGIFEKFTRARKYKRVSKETFKIIERVSNRADTNNVMAQFSGSSGESGRPPQPPPTGTTSTHTNPFADSHAVPTLGDIDVSNVSQVEMTTFESEPTGEGAVIMELQDRDGTTRDVVATFPLEGISGHRANEGSKLGAETATVSSYDTHDEVYSLSEASCDVGQLTEWAAGRAQRRT